MVFEEIEKSTLKQKVLLSFQHLEVFRMNALIKEKLFFYKKSLLDSGMINKIYDEVWKKLKAQNKSFAFIIFFYFLHPACT